MTERTALYRAFDASGTLVYVGVAWNWGHRWSQHSLRSAFFAEVARLDIEWHPTRAAALIREAELILEHRPRFNLRSGALPRPRAAQDLECDTCGCYYFEDADEGVTLGSTCGDWSRTQDPARACQGRLVVWRRR